jgi:hypothetical protein
VKYGLIFAPNQSTLLEEWCNRNARSRNAKRLISGWQITRIPQQNFTILGVPQILSRWAEVAKEAGKTNGTFSADLAASQELQP